MHSREYIYSNTTEFRKIVTTPPEYARGSLRENGLVQGYATRHISTTQEHFLFQSLGRIVCDSMLLLTLYEDGSADVTLTHYLPGSNERRAGKTITNAVRQKRHKEGTRFAVILTSFPFIRESLDEDGTSFQGLVDTVRKFNNDHQPDIIAVNPAAVSGDSDLIITREIRDGQTRYSLSVTNSDYHRTLTHQNAKSAALDQPVYQEIYHKRSNTSSAT